MLSAILKSKTGRQLLGAAVGMLAAVAVYFAIQELSSLSVSQALLISPTNVSEHAQQIRVNDKNIDDTTLQIIARHAQSVAAVMKGQTASSSSQTESSAASAAAPALNGAISTARQMRLAREAGVNYYPAPAQAATQAQRIQFRNDQAQAARTALMPSKVAMTSSSVSASEPAVQTVVSRTEIENQETITPVKAQASQKSSHLPNSGFGLETVILVSLLIAFFASCNPVRQRLIAVAGFADTTSRSKRC